MSTPKSLSDLKSLKVTELKAELSRRGLDTSGLKVVLLERLETALKEEASEAAGEMVIVGSGGGKSGDGTAVAKLGDQDDSSKPEARTPAGLSQGADKNLTIEGESGHQEVSEYEAAKPAGVEDDGVGAANLAAVANGSDEGPSGDGASKEDEKDNDVDNVALQKRIKRAERFGTTLSEDSKRKFRAEKFGHDEEGKKKEDGKKAARAARFGFNAEDNNDRQVDAEASAAEAAKKVARAERFKDAVDDKPGNGKSVDPATGAADAEKRAARAKRFGGDGKPSTPPTGEELEKRKRRAERFGLPLKGESELEARKKVRTEKFGPVAPATA